MLVPLTTIVLTGVAERDAGLASGVLNVGQQLGGSLGLAVIASAAATEAGRAATSQGKQLLDQYGLSEHVLNFADARKVIAGRVDAGADRPRSM